MGLKKFSTLKKDELIELIKKESQKSIKNTKNTKKESSTKGDMPKAEENIQSDTELSKQKNCEMDALDEEEKAEESSDHEKESEKSQNQESNVEGYGVLEVMADGYGFLRAENFLPGSGDIYISPSQIRRFNLKTGDMVKGYIRMARENEKFNAMIYVKTVNNDRPDVSIRRPNFEDLTPIYPDKRLTLEGPNTRGLSERIIDLVAPIGKGQRGMIVAPPKVGKTTLLKKMANAIVENHKDVNLIILLIDERPEEVTDMQRSIQGENVEIVYSTFDELPEHHKRVAEMVLERAKRLVEQGQDVVVLLDSITRMARAYNIINPPSGRTLSGGLDPASLYMPKKFFGAARNIENGGSLTVLATALVDTGSKMDEVIFEEFKGTGNMELVLDRKLSERRVFPAIDIIKSGTRRDDLLLSEQEQEAAYIIRRNASGTGSIEYSENIISLMAKAESNDEFVKKLPYIEKNIK